MSKLPSTARVAVNSTISVLNGARSRAYASGSYIGQGLVGGLRSQIGSVRAAAASLASAADAAIRAKAKIHSPSKVTEEDAEYMGAGVVRGLKNMIPDVWKMAEKLVMTPSLVSMKAPEFALAGSYHSIADLKDEYSYRDNRTYNIIVPLEIDGREFAKATAPYTQEELEKQEKKNNRKHGRR